MTFQPPMLLAVAAGGALGAVLRHAVGAAALRTFGPGFPWGTLTVNVLGSFCMGALVSWMALRGPVSQELRGFLAVGCLGAFTTFSTFSLDVAVLFERKDMGPMAAYVAVSVLCSILALFAGLVIVRRAL